VSYARTYARTRAGRLSLPLAAALTAAALVPAGTALGQAGGTLAPGDPQIAKVECLTRCISPSKGTVKSKVRILGRDLSQVAVVSLPRIDGKRAKDKKPIIKPSGAVIARIGKRARTGPIRIRDSFGQVRDQSGSFAIGTRKELRQAQLSFRFPIPGPHNYGSAGSRFGSARSGHSHQGQDVFAACGTPLIAARGGIVKYKGFQSSAGNYVVIDGAGVKQDHVYMHLKGPARVSKGQSVTTGQRLGKVGDTGNASGCHLHFEIWVGKGWYSGGRPIDPYSTLKYWDSYS